MKRKIREYESNTRQKAIEAITKRYYQILQDAIDSYDLRDLEDARWKRLGGQTLEDFIKQQYELRKIKLGLTN
tara:strand:- start:814 stop:1032 length:219 start_codon:yes stop_codon:yes gene_type:complete